jgi:hypothetical protein
MADNDFTHLIFPRAQFCAIHPTGGSGPKRAARKSIKVRTFAEGLFPGG